MHLLKVAPWGGGEEDKLFTSLDQIQCCVYHEINFKFPINSNVSCGHNTSQSFSSTVSADMLENTGQMSQFKPEPKICQLQSNSMDDITNGSSK